jgi:hypothetical protein
MVPNPLPSSSSAEAGLSGALSPDGLGSRKKILNALPLKQLLKRLAL